MSDKENQIFENEMDDPKKYAVNDTYRKETRICGIRGESGNDFLLPDYMGDIKRVLKSKADVCMSNKFIGSEEISFLMQINYRVLYLDAEDNLTEAVFTSDYDCSQKTEVGFVDADLECKIQSLNIRLQGPRKICAKVSLVSEMRVSSECDMGELADVKGAECMPKTIKIHSARYIKFPEREYAEQITGFEGISADEAEVIKSDAYACINSCRKSEDGILITGDVKAYALVRIGEEIIRTEKSLPFEERINAEDEATGEFYTAKGYISSVCANMNNEVSDNGGAGVYASLVMNFTLECYVICDKNTDMSIVCDAYMCGKKNKCSYRSFAYNEMLGSHSEKKKISLTVKRDNTPIRSIIDYDAEIKNIRFSTDGSELAIFGAVDYNFVINTIQPVEIKCIKGECEIEEKIKLSWLPDKQKIKVSLVPCEISPAFDGENIYITMTVHVNVFEETIKNERIISKLEYDLPEQNRERSVIVYYPEKDETVWDVAKKYATSVFDIIKNNSLMDFEEEAVDKKLAGVERLIIVNNK